MPAWLSSFLSAIVLSSVVGIVLSALRKRIPSPPKPALDAAAAWRIKELDERFSATQRWVLLLAVVMMGLLGLGLWKLLRWANAWFAASEGDAAFVLLPSPVVFVFFPFFAALSCAWPLTESLLPFLLGREESALYIQWTNVKAEFDVRRAFRWMTILVPLPIGLLTLPAVPVHATLHEEELHVRDYLTLRSVHHRYDAVREITVNDGIRNKLGKFIPDPSIVLTFHDGSTWSSADQIRDPAEAIDERLKAFLERKTGNAARYEPLARDLTPPGTVPEPWEPLRVIVRRPSPAVWEGEMRIGSVRDCEANRRASFYWHDTGDWMIDLTAPVGDTVCVRTRRPGGQWGPWRRQSPRWLSRETPKRLEFPDGGAG